MGRDARQTATPGHHTEGSLYPAPDVVAQRVGDEVIIVNLRTNRMHSLNRTGARLWDLLTTEHDIARIHAQLVSEFDVDPVQLDHEIGAILASLKEAGIVQAERA